jgi:hypothetical protein
MGIYDVIKDEWEQGIEPLMMMIREEADHTINYPFNLILNWQHMS